MDPEKLNTILGVEIETGPAMTYHEIRDGYLTIVGQY